MKIFVNFNYFYKNTPTELLNNDISFLQDFSYMYGVIPMIKNKRLLKKQRNVII